MNRPDEPALPEGLPPEFADAYRRGYLSALGEDPDAPAPADALAGTGRHASAPLFADEGHDSELTVLLGGSGPADEARHAREDDPAPRRSRYLVPVLLVAMALVLVAGAYVTGRALSDGAGGADGDGAGGRATQASAGGDPAGPTEQAYTGPVATVDVSEASATCQAADSIDAAGNPASYPPARAIDEDLSTAWRCDGSGAGVRLTLTLPEDTVVGEVGIVPGYAKTDPANGVDRYAENNRITKVRWIFDNGTSYVQEMSGAADDRSLRTMRVPRVTTRAVVVEILTSKRGARNTVAISELRVGAARD